MSAVHTHCYTCSITYLDGRALCADCGSWTSPLEPPPLDYTMHWLLGAVIVSAAGLIVLILKGFNSP